MMTTFSFLGERFPYSVLCCDHCDHKHNNTTLPPPHQPAAGHVHYGIRRGQSQTSPFICLPRNILISLLSMMHWEFLYVALFIGAWQIYLSALYCSKYGGDVSLNMTDYIIPHFLMLQTHTKAAFLLQHTIAGCVIPAQRFHKALLEKERERQCNKSS